MEKSETCPVCSGRGQVWHRTRDRLGYSTAHWDPCSFCGGAGQVTEELYLDWVRERDRIESAGQAEYYQESREFEQDRATWAQDRVQA